MPQRSRADETSDSTIARTRTQSTKSTASAAAAACRGVPRSEESPHHEPEIHGREVGEIPLLYVVPAAQAHAPMGAGLARVGEGPLDALAPQSQELLAFGAPHPGAVLVKGFAGEHPALVREAALPLLRRCRNVRSILGPAKLEEQLHLVVGWRSSDGHGGLELHLAKTLRPWTTSTKPRLDSAAFFLGNFVETRGAMIRESRSSRYAGRQIVDVGGWRLTVDLLPGQLHRTLRATGGYGFTHIVEAKRLDKTAFTGEQLDELLVKLYWILSFLRGGRTAPMLASGFSGKELVWHGSHVRVVDAWEGHQSLLPARAFLGELITCCWALLGQERARTIETCIHWYVEANNCRGGVEGALVMTLTALERLAWLELVQRRRCLSAEGSENHEDRRRLRAGVQRADRRR